MKNEKGSIELLLAVVVVCIIAIGLMFGLPVWSVWKEGLSGEGQLAKAEQTKKIMIETARAEVEASTLRAKAIKIMGQAAKDYPEYREQELMQAFGEALNNGAIQKIVYIPTEANMPILEAGKRD